LRGFAAFAGARADRACAAAHNLALVYDHDPEDVAALGWEEFIARQWESIFIGYRSHAGLRRICRRWSDLFEAGLGCPQDVADLLVRNEILDRADRDLESAIDGRDLVAGMAAVLADVRTDLVELAGAPEGLLGAHARLLGYIRAYAFGPDAGEPIG
jgi:hypothetical protein